MFVFVIMYIKFGRPPIDRRRSLRDYSKWGRWQLNPEMAFETVGYIRITGTKPNDFKRLDVKKCRGSPIGMKRL